MSDVFLNRGPLTTCAEAGREGRLWTQSGVAQIDSSRHRLQDVRVKGAGSRQIWREEGLVVNARLTDDGALVFAGHDLSGSPFGDEYEYWVTVPAKDIPTVIAALDGQPGDDVLDLVARRAESIIRQGEQTWVKSLGIEPGFYSW